MKELKDIALIILCIILIVYLLYQAVTGWFVMRFRYECIKLGYPTGIQLPYGWYCVGLNENKEPYIVPHDNTAEQ